MSLISLPLSTAVPDPCWNNCSPEATFILLLVNIKIDVCVTCSGELVLVLVVIPQFGGQAYSDVEHTSVQCHALDGIECASPRTFLRENKPCIK